MPSFFFRQSSVIHAPRVLTPVPRVAPFSSRVCVGEARPGKGRASLLSDPHKTGFTLVNRRWGG
jgi:hypothetical protein